MAERKNILSQHISDFAGPWPHAIAWIMTIIFGGQVFLLLLGLKPNPLTFFGSALVAAGCVWSAFYLKKRYRKG